MMEEKTTRKANVLFTLLQGVAVIIGLCGTIAAIYLGLLGAFALETAWTERALAFGLLAVWGLVTVVGVSGCSYAALFHFFMLCKRLRKETAFTLANQRCMSRIGRCCAVCSVLLVIAFAVFFVEMSALAWYGVLALAFAYGCVALVAFALKLLLRRALLLQQENDLTI